MNTTLSDSLRNIPAGNLSADSSFRLLLASWPDSRAKLWRGRREGGVHESVSRL